MFFKYARFLRLQSMQINLVLLVLSTMNDVTINLIGSRVITERSDWLTYHQRVALSITYLAQATFLFALFKAHPLRSLHSFSLPLTRFNHQKS